MCDKAVYLEKIKWTFHSVMRDIGGVDILSPYHIALAVFVMSTSYLF